MPEVEELPTTEVNDHVYLDNSEDEDGLDGSETAESYDELYLDVERAAEEEKAKVHAGELKILHGSGNSKLKRTCNAHNHRAVVHTEINSWQRMSFC